MIFLQHVEPSTGGICKILQLNIVERIYIDAHRSLTLLYHAVISVPILNLKHNAVYNDVVPV